MYLNHSCNPNGALVTKRLLIALRPIAAGEEITMDYSLTDSDPFWEIKCSCGAPSCRKHIRAIQTLPLRTYRRYLPNIPVARNPQSYLLHHYQCLRFRYYQYHSYHLTYLMHFLSSPVPAWVSERSRCLRFSGANCRRCWHPYSVCMSPSMRIALTHSIAQSPLADRKSVV